MLANMIFFAEIISDNQNVGKMVHWYSGKPAYWFTVVLVFWQTRYSLMTLYQATSMLASWYNGILLSQCAGLLLCW